MLMWDAMATVEYLNYRVLTDKDWELEDDDLFEKAEDLADSGDLDEEDFGRFEVDESEYIRQLPHPTSLIG